MEFFERSLKIVLHNILYDTKKLFLCFANYFLYHSIGTRNKKECILAGCPNEVPKPVFAKGST